MNSTLNLPAIDALIDQLDKSIRDAADKSGDSVKSIAIIVNRQSSGEVRTAGCCCAVCAAEMARDLLRSMTDDWQAAQQADAAGSVH